MSDRPDLRGALRVKPGTKVDLSKLDPGQTHGRQKESAEQEISELLGRMAQLQDKLWAEQKHALLIVLQGIDASGKDGSIRTLLRFVNPAGVETANFKVPSAEEAAPERTWGVPGRVRGVHVTPLSAEVWTPAPPSSTSLVASADIATIPKSNVPGCWVHVAPASEEKNRLPPGSKVEATSFVPSADDAT